MGGTAGHSKTKIEVKHNMHKRFIFPVGQGGFSIEKIDGFVVVYDCGSVSSPNAVEQSIDKIQQDTDHVDVLFISHFDKDHVNGIKHLDRRCKIKNIIVPQFSNCKWFYIVADFVARVYRGLLSKKEN